MCKSRQVILADELVNLTDESISLYSENTGEIFTVEPLADNELENKNSETEKSLQKKDSQTESTNRERNRLFYIVDEDTIDKIKKSGRRLDNVAFVRCCGIGRNGVPVSYLAHAIDPDVIVRLI